MGMSSGSLFRQRGAVLLLLVLVLIILASFSLLVTLNADTNSYIRQHKYSQQSLRLAKQALIGYAVIFPEIDRKSGTDAINGPGYLPCPDHNNNGSAAGSCSFAGGTTTGRLPYTTLEVPELTDSTGARLWYILSDNFRNNPAREPLNSDTTGQLTVDGRTDIVAVIIAPGAPIGEQTRNPAETDIVAEITHYLENDNNDLDRAFISVDSDSMNATDFNDSLVFITRRELMQPIEKRVLAMVAAQWNTYQDEMAAFPWLSRFDNPDTSAFKSSPGSYTGHIPFHYSGDMSRRNPFTDDITLSWAISGATLMPVPDADESGAPRLPVPTSACVANSGCLNPVDPFSGRVFSLNDIAGASCIWTDRDTFDCAGSFSARIDRVTFTDMAGTLNRLYEFDITFSQNRGAGPNLNPPTSGSSRTRDLTIFNGALAADAVQIIVTDTLTEIDYAGAYADAPVSKQASLILISNDGTTGIIVATDILYDLDLDGLDRNGDGDFLDTGADLNNNGNFYDAGDSPPDVVPDLPAWFARNEWYKHVHIAYAASEPLPGDLHTGQDCNVLGACLSLKGTADDDIRAIAVIAGEDLNRNRPSANLADYFELENTTPSDGVLQKAAITDSFNDQVRIIERAR